MKSVFDGFEDVDDIKKQFSYNRDGADVDLDESRLEWIFAAYNYEDYSGSAAVVFKYKYDDKIYAVYGGHCSCNGLEGEWKPEETSIESLKAQATNGYQDYNKDILKFLEEL